MITNFFEFENENMGGNESFRFIPSDNIVTDAEVDETTMTVNAMPVLESSLDFLTGIAVMDTLDFNESQSNDVPGELYTTQISGTINGNTKEYLALFAEMARHRHVLEIKDNNGKLRLAGKKLNGLIFTFTSYSSKLPSAPNAMDFVFTGQSSKPSPFVDITVIS